MLLGAAGAVITPSLGTFLAGFGYRNHGAEGVLDDLEVRVLWFQSEEAPSQAACIITADVIGFDNALASRLTEELSHTQSISPSAVLLAASHTHSGPQICANMLGVGVLDPVVVDQVCKAILRTAAEARRVLRPVRLYVGHSHLEGYAVNRRLIRDGRAVFAPNPSGSRDDEVTVIACREEDNANVRAILFHYTCHPTTMGDYRITSDYPGAARRYIEGALGTGAVAAFLPGCFGDVRPACTYVGGKTFRSGVPEDVHEFGTALGETVMQVISQRSLRSITPALGGEKIEVSLPLVHRPNAEELQQKLTSESPIQRAWARQIIAAGDRSEPRLTLQRLDLGRELTFIALGGEVCSDYGRLIKRLGAARTVLPVGYSNGLTAYIPSARMFAEGGYEVDESTLYYGLPAPFSPEIESHIITSVKSLLSQTVS